MKRFFKFLFWCTQSVEEMHMWGIVGCAWIIIGIMIAFWSVPHSLATVFFGMIASLIFRALWWAGTYVFSAWQEFSRRYPPDDVLIMRKLKGEE